MRKFIILSFLLFSFSCYASSSESKYKIVKEKINVNIDVKRAILFCSDEVEILENNYEIIKFRLTEEAKIINILIDNKNVTYNFKKGIVEVRVDKGRKNLTLLIYYSINFPGEIDLKYIDYEDPSSNLISHISREGIFIGGEVLWYPIFNVKPEKREVTFTSEKGIEFLTEGIRIEHKEYNNTVTSTWLIDNNIRSLPILGGEYIVKMKKMDEVQLFIYSFKENVDLQEKYLLAIEDYLKFYSKLIGPYPYKKFAVVETHLPVGISYQTFTIINKKLIRLPFIVDTSLPHEILHSWFGNGVFVDYKNGNWSEGLVTYLADYLMKERKSKEEAIEYLKKLTIDYSSVIKEEKEFSLMDFYGRNDLTTRVVGYGKSAMFFHYLRFYMGDEKFFESLRNFYKGNLFKAASWSNLKSSFADNYSDEIDIIFEQWIKRKGVPEIGLKNISKDFNGKEWIVRFSIEQKDPCYLLKLPLKIYGSNSKVLLDKNIIVKEKISGFSFITIEEPVEIRINENYDVLRKLREEEIPATVNSIKSAEKILLVPNSNYFQEEFIERFVKTMGLKNYRISKSLDYDYEAIVFLGVSEKVKYKNILIDKNFFEIDNIKYEDKNNAIFLVIREGNKYKAYFQSFSVEGALKISQKITHYGPFSYLIFKDGVNIDKGLLDVDKNVLFFKF